jgi:hypothetical protein
VQRGENFPGGAAARLRPPIDPGEAGNRHIPPSGPAGDGVLQPDRGLDAPGSAFAHPPPVGLWSRRSICRRLRVRSCLSSPGGGWAQGSHSGRRAFRRTDQGYPAAVQMAARLLLTRVLEQTARSRRCWGGRRPEGQAVEEPESKFPVVPAHRAELVQHALLQRPRRPPRPRMDRLEVVPFGLIGREVTLLSEVTGVHLTGRDDSPLGSHYRLRETGIATRSRMTLQ